MHHIKLAGSYHKMGLDMASRMSRVGGFPLPEQPEKKVKFGMECEKMVRDFFPEFLEEMKAFAEGCHIAYDQMAAFMLTVGVFDAIKCSVFVARSNNDVVFGRNYDFTITYKKDTMSFYTVPENGYRHIAHADMFVGRADGVNEKGLAVGGSSVFGNAIKPGITFLVAERYILDKCATVAEGLEVLLKLQYVSANNYLLADRSGDMAVVETSVDRVRVRRPEKGESFVTCTNHFVHPEMQEMENLELSHTEGLYTQERYDAIHNALKQYGKGVNIEKAQKILADHKSHVCCHWPGWQISTLWSVVASLKEPQIFTAEGSPCKAKYKPDLRLKA